jgi:hypothetical protein
MKTERHHYREKINCTPSLSQEGPRVSVPAPVTSDAALCSQQTPVKVWTALAILSKTTNTHVCLVCALLRAAQLHIAHKPPVPVALEGQNEIG